MEIKLTDKSKIIVSKQYFNHDDWLDIRIYCLKNGRYIPTKKGLKVIWKPDKLLQIGQAIIRISGLEEDPDAIDQLINSTVDREA